MPPIEFGNMDYKPIKVSDKPNKFEKGQKILVRAFDYGDGFEKVNEAYYKEDFTYYEVELKSVIKPKNQQNEYVIMYSQVPDRLTMDTIVSDTFASAITSPTASSLPRGTVPVPVSEF